MQIAYNIVLWLGLLIAVVFAGLIFLTGKGDAMSGGSGAIRTTFKGKASFEDRIGQITLMLGFAFMGLMLILDFIAIRLRG